LQEVEDQHKEERNKIAMQLLHCQLESTVPPAAQFLLSQSQEGDAVQHHVRVPYVLERIPRPSCAPLHATNTSHLKQKIFLFEYSLEVSHFAYKKHTTERCSSVVYSSITVAILTTETSV
jgi:hypothetical protein